MSVSPDGQRLLPETGPRAVRLKPPGAGGFGCPGAVETVGCNFPERERRKKLRHSRAAFTGRPQSRVLRAPQRCPSEGQMLPPSPGPALRRCAGYEAGRRELSSPPSRGSTTGNESRRRLAGVGSAEGSATVGRAGCASAPGAGPPPAQCAGRLRRCPPVGGQLRDLPAHRGCLLWSLVAPSVGFPLWWFTF